MNASLNEPPSFSNVEQADFILRLTEGEPWALPLRWEDVDGAGIDISGAGWAVNGVLRLPNGERPIACTMTLPMDGRFEPRLDADDVAVLSTARPDRLVVTIQDPSLYRFHFVFPLIRRLL